MTAYAITYLVLLTLALIFQGRIKKTNATPNPSKKPWGKFLVFALLSPAIMAVYFLKPAWSSHVHLIIALVILYEVLSNLVQAKVLVSLWGAFFLVSTLFLVWNFWFVTKSNSLFTSVDLVSVYFTVVIFDSFSQLTGQLFGKRKIFPKISPNKTYAGLYLGFVFALVTTYILGHFTEKYTLAFAQQVMVLVLAFVGDTLASWTKRRLKVKDFSNLVPYQGGFLDRFDSYLVASLTLPIFSLLHTNF